MHLATHLTAAGPRPAALTTDHSSLLDLGHVATDVRSVLARSDVAHEVRQAIENASADAWVPSSSVTLGPPVPNPGKIVCLGRNYAEHAAEGNASVPEHPMYFMKPTTCLIGHGQAITVPTVDECVDYEGELVVVISRAGRNIAKDVALDHVGGYTIGNDVSARTWQRRTSQFAAGKMADGFGPTGPAVVTADEIDDPSNLTITTTLNDTVMQNGSTGDMVFDIATIIADLSSMTTLEPGDLIFTGTPEGVGFARNPPVWMVDGDQVTVEISSLGSLTNPVQGPGLSDR